MLLGGLPSTVFLDLKQLIHVGSIVMSLMTLRQLNDSQYSLSFGMCQYMTFEIRGLSEFFVASIERANVRSVSCMYPYVSSENIFL